MPVVKPVGVDIKVTGAADAKLKISEVSVAAEKLKTLNPEITPKIDSAKAMLEARILRAGLAAELSKGLGGPAVAGGGVASNVAGMLTPMTGLVAAGVALAPVIATLAVGMAGFGAATYAAVGPVLKAAQATGGLKAHMNTLTGPQRTVAAGFLSLQASFDQFARSMQPRVFSALNSGLAIARTLMKETGPVAKATGTALDQVLASVNKGLQSAQWRQFFSWMAANAGPDVLLVGRAVGTLINDLPPLVMALQPVAVSVLGLAVDLGKLVGGIETVVTAEGKLAIAANKSSGVFGRLWGAAKQAFGQLVPGAAAVGGLRAALDKAAPSAAKAGTSIKILGAVAQTSAQQVTSLYTALHTLLDPLQANITDAVTFKADQVALAAALRNSRDAVGLHTSATRASATAMVTATQDALTLSQAVYNQTGSARKAIGPLQALVTQLERSGAKGAYAREEIRRLEAAIAALKSKTVSVNIVTTSTGAVLGVPGGGHPLAAPHAAGGPASGLIRVGEMGPELLRVPPGSYVYSNQQSRAMLSGGGNTYNITVSALVADKNAGRLVVEAIRKFEQGSGAGWRKR